MGRVRPTIAGLALWVAAAGCGSAGGPGRSTSGPSASLQDLPGIASDPCAPVEANLRIADVFLNQSVDVVLVPEGATGQPPVIAGRAATLRVFAQIDGDRAAVAQGVSVAVYAERDGLALEESPRVVQLDEIPESPQLDVWSQGAHVSIPASWIQPGTSIRVAIDADDRYCETDEDDNVVPAAGALDLGAQVAPPLRVVVVPVIQDGHTPDPDAFDEIVSWLQATYPVPAVESTVHAPVVYAGSPVEANGMYWYDVLTLVTSIRDAESSDPDLYYYGVLSPGYADGVRGLAWQPASPASPLPVAVGTDAAGGAGPTAAHEIGHNHGRLHVDACQTGGTVDAEYPHPGGVIGVVGWQPGTETLYAADARADFMSDCDAVWISDYTTTAIHAWDVQVGSAALRSAPTLDPIAVF